MLTHTSTSPIPPARVIVLGRQGFVASHVVRHLTEVGVSVLALSSAELDLTHRASVNQLSETLCKHDALVFISALTPDRGRDIATMILNLQMGQHVCAALAQTPCSHILYLSSDAVYHDNANPIRESSCTQPSSYHGVMHLARERMLIETSRTASVPLALLRPSLLYGPGDTHNGYGPNRFVRAAFAGDTINLFGNGEEQRDHVFVGDVAALIGLALHHRSSGILNIATGVSRSFQQVAKAVASVHDGSTEIQISRRANPITHRHFDISERLDAFPDFLSLPLTEGLTQMIQDLSSTQ